MSDAGLGQTGQHCFEPAPGSAEGPWLACLHTLFGHCLLTLAHPAFVAESLRAAKRLPCTSAPVDKDPSCMFRTLMLSLNHMGP